MYRYQKLYGYVKELGKWREFSSWDLMKMSEADYRIWHDKYEKTIHVQNDENSPIIFFNRGHRTFSYFSENDKSGDGKGGLITLSHVFRQHVLATMKEATFSIENRIYGNNKTRELITIKFKKVYIEPKLNINGETYIPDLKIEFEEPALLALKWNQTLYVEIVETNESEGKKVEAFRSIPCGLIEIPHTKFFNDLDSKKLNDITINEANDFKKKIFYTFKKEIWSDLIVDSPSIEYLEGIAQKELFNKNVELEMHIDKLAKKNSELLEELEKLKNNNNKQQMEVLSKQKTINELQAEYNKVESDKMYYKNFFDEKNKKKGIFQKIWGSD